MPQRARTRSTQRRSRPVRRHKAAFLRNPSYRNPTVYTGTVTNAGTVATSPMITVTGPVSGASVFLENVTARQTVWVNVTVGAGQELVVNFSTKAVTLDGVALAASVVSIGSRWWLLSPGANTVRSNAQASVSHHDAYTG